MGHRSSAQDVSPPIQSLPTWARIVAFVGLPSLLVVGLTAWLTTRVTADQRTQIAIAADTKTLIEQHVLHTHEDLERIGQLLYVQCKNAAKTRQASNLCEVGR